ncbi:hypothetical protein FS799_14865 [Agrobacterium vitis]|nr:hypothetical protein [Agrobacterium vitis]MUO69712.1 hypothetical protein [Agrobacterium vitis]MUO83005.1 hypothetical protein [Agrobacterium vitis]MVA36682.1 hypothetical protein [Agrobacterium vitis]
MAADAMSDNLAAALALYVSGDYQGTYATLQPLLAKNQDAGPQALLIMAQCCAKLEQFTEAATFYRRAGKLLPAQASVLITLADKMERSGVEKASALEIEALTASRRAIRAGGFDLHSWQTYRAALRHTLNIDEMRVSDQAVRDRLNRRQEAYYSVDSQTVHLSWCDDEVLNGLWRSDLPAAKPASQTWKKHAGSKLKIAYLLADEPQDDPRRCLVLSLAAAHDQADFEVLLIGSRLQTADEASNEIPSLSISDLREDDAVATLRTAGIDILVDPLGYGEQGRPNLLRHRIAPLHLAMAGHPGTRTGLVCDYLLADTVVLPQPAKASAVTGKTEAPYSPAICYLPEAFTVTPPTLNPPALSRQQRGLPENRIILAAFHPIDSISPRTADLWRDILLQTDDSVLWSTCDNNYARSNFSAWMKRQGIDENRLLFCTPARATEHASWIQLADIALDCFPSNNQSSTLAALQAGLPIPTFPGVNFASRMTASLLHAHGLDELIARDADAYVALCATLVRDKRARAALKQKILAQNAVSPLFDVARFTSHLEAAYRSMTGRAAAGLEPEDFSVTNPQA